MSEPTPLPRTTAVGDVTLAGLGVILVRTLIGRLTVTVLRVGISPAGVHPAFEPMAYGRLVVLVVALTADRSGVVRTG